MNNMTTLWLFSVFIQLLFWGNLAGGALQRIRRRGAAMPLLDGRQPMVSVVVCARNEAANLQKHLPFLLQQQYPNFEIIVVDDASTDETAAVLSAFQRQNPRLLRILTLTDKTTIGKKRALAAGIAAAAGDWLLLTDADCQPVSEEWIATMMQARLPDTEIVLGYGAYRNNGTWLHRWVQWETIFTAIQYFSAAAIGDPYMGVGRNLLYKKALYHRVNGFSSHAHLPSGDDDLLVNAAATARNTAYCLHPDAWTISEPQATWAGWLRQKRRHASVGGQYRLRHQVALAALAVSYLVFYAGWWLWLAGLLAGKLLIIGILARQIVWFLTSYVWLARFNQKKFISFACFLDIFVPVYFVVMAWGRGNPHVRTWKRN